MAEIIRRHGEDQGRLSEVIEELREDIKALRAELQYCRLFDSPAIMRSEYRR